MIPGGPSSLSTMANPRRFVDAAFMQKHFTTLYGGGLGKSPDRARHMSRLRPPTTRGYMYQLLAMLGVTPDVDQPRQHGDEHDQGHDPQPRLLADRPEDVEDRVGAERR